MTNLPIVYPMGAKSDDKRVEKAWEDDSYWGEAKFDGSRYLCRIENDEVRFVSRQKSKSTGLPVDKTENVPHLVRLFSNFPNGTIFDGEIITHENCTSNDVTSIMGSLPARAIELQEERGYVKYVVFDILFYDGTDFRDQPYQIRRKAVERLVPMYNYVFPAHVEKVNKREFHNSIILDGGEGTILKNIHKPYIAGKKPTDTWLKVKKYNTFDVVVLGYTKATREYTGKDPDNWLYWAKDTGFGSCVEIITRSIETVDSLKLEGYMPVTKDFAMGWIGAVKFGQWFPADKYEEKRKEGHISLSTQVLNFDGVMHHLVEIGQTDGLSDEWKEKFTQEGHLYVNSVIEVGGMEQLTGSTYAIRHPRFIRIHPEKSSKDCIAGEY
jgi:hypothetical protein